MRHYTHFTINEREKSSNLLAQGLSLRAIARKLNRSPSSVCRELARNTKADGTYSPNHANNLYKKRRKNCGRTPILTEGKAREYVLEKLNLRWSPEQIAGRAKRDKEPFGISFATIYRAIDAEACFYEFRNLPKKILIINETCLIMLDDNYNEIWRKYFSEIVGDVSIDNEIIFIEDYAHNTISLLLNTGEVVGATK